MHHVNIRDFVLGGALGFPMSKALRDLCVLLNFRVFVCVRPGTQNRFYGWEPSGRDRIYTNIYI